MANQAYTPEEIERIFEEILEYIEEGKSLRSILSSSDMPSSRTFYKWLDEDKEKVKRYARATEIRAEAIFEDMLEIADDGTNDFMTITKGDLEYNIEDKEVTNRSRLRLDTRKWMLSKMQPKKYGDKLDVTSDGDALQAPKKLVIKVNRRNKEDE